MKSKAVLKMEDRNFFSLVVKAIYMNPFLDERQEVLFQISPRWYQDRTTAPELNERISRLERKGLSKIKHFKEEDAQLMMHAYLNQEYIRFFPRWRYLRYDRNPPPLALALIPDDRSLSNPFYYYSGSAEEESYATYRILLRRMAESGAQIVVLHRWPMIVELAAKLGQENLVAAHGFDQYRFPYRAQRGHNSGWGNRMLAAQFLAHLVEDVELEAPVMLTRDAPLSELTLTARAPMPISAYDRIELMLDDAPLGSFVSASRDYFRGGQGGATGLAGSEVVSLLAVKDPRISLVDAGFAPLDFAPVPGAEVSLRVGEGGDSRVHPIGRVQALAPGSPIAVVTRTSPTTGPDCVSRTWPSTSRRASAWPCRSTTRSATAGSPPPTWPNSRGSGRRERTSSARSRWPCPSEQSEKNSRRRQVWRHHADYAMPKISGNRTSVPVRRHLAVVLSRPRQLQGRRTTRNKRCPSRRIPRYATESLTKSSPAATRTTTQASVLTMQYRR